MTSSNSLLDCSHSLTAWPSIICPFIAVGYPSIAPPLSYANVLITCGVNLWWSNLYRLMSKSTKLATCRWHENCSFRRWGEPIGSLYGADRLHDLWNVFATFHQLDNITCFIASSSISAAPNPFNLFHPTLSCSNHPSWKIVPNLNQRRFVLCRYFDKFKSIKLIRWLDELLMFASAFSETTFHAVDWQTSDVLFLALTSSALEENEKTRIDTFLVSFNRPRSQGQVRPRLICVRHAWGDAIDANTSSHCLIRSTWHSKRISRLFVLACGLQWNRIQSKLLTVVSLIWAELAENARRSAAKSLRNELITLNG